MSNPTHPRPAWPLLLLVVVLADAAVARPFKGRRSGKSETASKGAGLSEHLTGTEKHEGLLTLHQGDGKLLLEIPSALLDAPLGLAAFNVNALGDYNMRGGSLDSQLVRWRRLGDRLVLYKDNLDFRADDERMRRILEKSFSDSPVFSAELLAGGDGDSALLIDASELFGETLTELLSDDTGYSVDGSTVTSIRCFPQNVVVRVSHRLKREGGSSDGGDGFARFQRPGRLPDERSAEAIVDYNLFQLPDDDFQPRFADERIGGFTREYKDYTDVDDRDSLFRHLLIRWDLRKQDPTAALSPPVEPITFTMDHSIPPKWRPLVREAALWWNASFEKVGIRDAVRVLDPPDDPEWDPADLRHSAIYWNFSDNLVFSGVAGPTLHDPRTGKVLKATVWLNGEFFSYALNRYLVYAWWRAPDPGAEHGAALPSRQAMRELRSHPHRCDRAFSFSSQIAFARLVLQARGVLKPGTPEAERFAREAFLELAAHEVGHALGFPHNWKASMVSSWDDIASGRVSGRGDRPFTASIMDYNPIYLAPRGQVQGDYFMHEVGAYDDLALQYIYRPLDGLNDDEQAKVLDAIAARAEIAPGLAFDAGGTGDIDPTTSSDDLGDDPLAFSESRLSILRHEVLPRLDELVRAEGHDDSLIRQALDSAIFSVAMDYIDIIARHVGGQVLLRRVVQSPASPNRGNPSITPIAAAEQRRALDILSRHVFADGSFALSPTLMSRLKADMLEDWNYPWRYQSDYSVAARIAGLHDAALSSLLEPARLARILDNERRISPGTDRFTLPELFSRLEHAAFSSRAGSPSQDRRSLQRLLVSRLEELVLRPDDGTPAEATQLAARSLRSVQGRCRSALDHAAGLDEYALAHYEDLAARAERALTARVVVKADD
ncbi:MAG: zinc-dependent metalloprotease [Acidobacteriota bacterium]